MTRNVVTTTIAKDGGVFDWSEVTGSLLRVTSNQLEFPAYAKVVYRGHEFSIDDGDLDSKSTFSMLNLVLALHASNRCLNDHPRPLSIHDLLAL